MKIQKRLAAELMKCGINRVWIDPTNEKVGQAITRNDVRGFIKEGIIKKLPVKKRQTKIKKRQQKTGSRKGRKGARIGKKNSWLKIVRPQRRLLRELKPKLEPRVYRKVYRMIKGNSFRSKAHLMNFLKDKKYLKEEKNV
jgi:large subunit ribosomal protein L19e